jgi:hypothetical protein
MTPNPDHATRPSLVDESRSDSEQPTINSAIINAQTTLPTYKPHA